MSDHHEIELYIYIRFFCLIVLGYNFYYYPELKKGLLILLKVGIALNFFAILIERTFIRGLTDGPTLAYSLQGLLVPALFLIFQMRTLKRNDRVVVIIGFALYFLEQVLFQKRLPLARIFFMIGILSYITSNWRLYGGQITIVAKNYFRYFIFGAFALGFMMLVGFNLFDYVQATLDRFGTSGEVTETVESDARWLIGEIIFDDLKDNNELIVGRGLGGVVYSNAFHLETAAGEKYRSASEMGIPTILLKGGFVFLGIVLVILFMALRAYKYVKISQIAFACWVVVFIWVVFLYAEGFIGSMRNINELIIGYSIGILLRITKLKRRWPVLLQRLNG